MKKRSENVQERQKEGDKPATEEVEHNPSVLSWAHQHGWRFSSYLR